MPLVDFFVFRLHLFVLLATFMFFSKRECENTVPIFLLETFTFSDETKKKSKTPKCRKKYIASGDGGFAKEGFSGEKKTSFGVKRL